MSTSEPPESGSTSSGWGSSVKTGADLGRVARVAALLTTLSACTTSTYNGSLGTPSQVGNLTRTVAVLADLPPPANRVNVAVYEFPDLTGQNRPNSNYADYSRAITQGAPAIVANALKSAGGGRWFHVVERTNLESLLRERRLIQDTYEVLKKNPREKIKPLEFAEYLVTGGIVSFDAPIIAANVNATYSGIGGAVSHNRNLVTINIRLVRVKDGSVLKSIDVSRQILSTATSASVNRPLAGTRNLEAEASLTVAEATQIAVREAIETGVYELIREGVQIGIWNLPKAEPKVRTNAAPASDVNRTATLTLRR